VSARSILTSLRRHMNVASHEARLRTGLKLSKTVCLCSHEKGYCTDCTVFLQCCPPFSSPDRLLCSPLFSCRRWQNRPSWQCKAVSFLSRGG